MTEAVQTSRAGSKVSRVARLLRDFHPVHLQLVESETDGGKLIIRGEFARCGVATENKRLYSRGLWEREIDRLHTAMENRRLFGELDHPNDGRTALKRVSHIITNLSIDEDGVVMGEAEVLPTPEGKALTALLQAGCQVGVSSRGYGSTRPNEKGEEVVQDDYRLVTYDVVAEPADGSAYPQVFSESKDTPVTEEQLEALRREERTRVEVELREEFADKLNKETTKLRSDLREELKKELQADPGSATAKTVLDKVLAILRESVPPEPVATFVRQKNGEIEALTKKLQARDERIQQLEDENAKLVRTAKEVGYKYILEHRLLGNPDAKEIIKAVGDVTVFESSKTLQARIDECCSSALRQREEKQKLQEQVAAANRQAAETRRVEQQRSVQAEGQVQNQQSKMQEALEKALEAQELTMLQLYTERRLRGHPQAARIAALVESSNCTTQEQVDKLISQYRTGPARGTEELDALRARVKARVGGGFAPSAADEERPSARATQRLEERNNGPDITGTGQSLDEFRTLAGVDQ